MKKKRNLLFLVLAVLFISLAGGGTVASAASSFPKLQAAPAGKIVSRNNRLYYRCANKKYCKNKYLRIKGKHYYFDSTGKAWYGMHTINGKKYYFGTRSQCYLYKNRLFRYKNGYYYAKKTGPLVTGCWYTFPSGKRYYFDSTGKAYTGKKTINKTTYYFANDGSLNHSGLNYNLTSDCAILINADTGKVLYAKNENLRHANASTTKIMTCILALENSKMNEVVKFSSRAVSMEATKLYARKGEKFYMKDLLYSLMIPSHNDTATAIAEHISGSQNKFVSLMNQKATALGCTNTHFATPNGLDAGYDHYTTASDLAKIASYAIEKPAFQKIVNTKSYSFRSINTRRRFSVSTTNELLGNTPGVIGMKTGYTNKAGYCFVGLCRSQRGNTYISVVLGGPTSNARWRDSRTLLNYAYKH
ncbi:serine hydrolase [Blautia sp. MSJ-19]|uniref:serine hydrolase n=1 Tax=Blautia sp. MSJ-19 TaxID=2841517 RepID=UPI001C0F3571|nr:serine hydrolase [Blautia sp. MSJ-19]MBU5480974.1 serine hydrolase [Blautia sp. MSJ-19]